MAKKRKAGDGLIRQRTDGRWEGRYVVGYAQGMRGEAEGADRRDESRAGGVEAAESGQALTEWTNRGRPGHDLRMAAIALWQIVCYNETNQSLWRCWDETNCIFITVPIFDCGFFRLS